MTLLEYGEILATRVEAKVIIEHAPDRIRISPNLLTSAPGPGIRIEHDLIHLGTEPDSAVTYQIVDWDRANACLLAWKVNQS